jgi:predicted GIY-YIG superfamily endonuclease
MKAGYVYIIASGRNGTLYIGVTSDLVKRVWEHRNGVVAGLPRNTDESCSSGAKSTTICKKHVFASCR